MATRDEAELILKLYELRRETVMRQARDWFAREFDPQSVEDIRNILMGEHSGYLRMVMSYWDMAAALVNHGAISPDLFNDTNGEHLFVYAKLEPLLKDMRQAFGPGFLANLEKLINGSPVVQERLALMRERLKTMRAEMAKRQTSTARG